MATVSISADSPYRSVNSFFSSDSEIPFFGVDFNGDDVIHNENSVINSFTIKIEGIDFIPGYNDPTFNYYNISDVILDSDDIGSRTSLTVSPYTTELGNDAFQIDVAGRFELGPALQIKYRQGLNPVQAVNSLDDVPSDASITRLIKPGQDSETSFSFTVITPTDTYVFSVPIIVKPVWGQAFNAGPILSASRKGDMGTGHGSYPPRSNNEGSPNVFIDGIAAHTVGHSWNIHCNPTPTCHGGNTSGGSSGVYINGQPLARVSDPVSCGSKIAQGSETVFSG